MACVISLDFGLLGIIFCIPFEYIFQVEEWLFENNSARYLLAIIHFQLALENTFLLLFLCVFFNRA